MMPDTWPVCSTHGDTFNPQCQECIGVLQKIAKLEPSAVCSVHGQAYDPQCQECSRQWAVASVHAVRRPDPRRVAETELVVMMARFLASYFESSAGIPDIKKLRRLADEVEHGR